MENEERIEIKITCTYTSLLIIFRGITFLVVNTWGSCDEYSFSMVPTIRLYAKNNSYSTFTEAVTAARNLGRHVACKLIKVIVYLQEISSWMSYSF